MWVARAVKVRPYCPHVVGRERVNSIQEIAAYLTSIVGTGHDAPLDAIPVQNQGSEWVRPGAGVVLSYGPYVVGRDRRNPIQPVIKLPAVG